MQEQATKRTDASTGSAAASTGSAAASTGSAAATGSGVVYVFGRTPPTDLLRTQLSQLGFGITDLRIYPDWIDTKKDILAEARRILNQSDILERKHGTALVVISSLGVLASAMTSLLLRECDAERFLIMQVYRATPFGDLHLSLFELPRCASTALPPC